MGVFNPTIFGPWIPSAHGHLQYMYLGDYDNFMHVYKQCTSKVYVKDQLPTRPVYELVNPLVNELTRFSIYYMRSSDL